MDANFWVDKYPSGIATSIDPERFDCITHLFREACQRFARRPAFSSLGHTLSYADLERQSAAFAAWLQEYTDLQPGDRIAIQLPNLLQFPVVVFGALRAGLVVVNTNPLYTAREMEHQFRDSGARALVCLANMAHLAEAVLPHTQIRHVVVTQVGDLLPRPRRWLVNAVVRHVRKMVPAYHLPQAIDLPTALARGRSRVQTLREHRAASSDVAILQYTGGTTGVAKGAMLTHRNLIANMLQCQALMAHNLEEGAETIIAPLPLYHIYAFTFHCLAMMLTGNHNVLISNPRDLPAMLTELRRWRFTGFVGLNTLFIALCEQPVFRMLDFSALKLTLSGGMALQPRVAERWESITGCVICEGYGLTETSPVVSVNPIQAIRPGTIGLPMPATACKVIDDTGQELGLGVPGELCVRGPQVMKGYWQREDATAEVLDAEGWLKTGDIAIIEADGYLRLVDRKKDMILVSGFNVYPNELEDVLSSLPGVRLAAAIGVPDARTGESIRVFVVREPDSLLDEARVLAHMHASLTSYKVPKRIEFRDSLPTSAVGKVLRRVLREEWLAAQGGPGAR